MNISTREIRVLTNRRKVSTRPGPVLILTINNGAAHTQAAEAIAAAWQRIGDEIPVQIAEVSEFMSRKARFTHVTAYLWLVKNAPGIWEKIDSYQKRQTSTTPSWYYRRECRKLFGLARDIRPSALVSTEVGCTEIAALIKKDLALDAPLVAVNLDYDSDRAWIHPEIDLYCLATSRIYGDFLRNGAEPDKVRVWGVPLDSGFRRLSAELRRAEREQICEWLELDPQIPLVLVAGGGEGLGEIKAVVSSLLDQPIQIVALTGRNEKLRRAFENIGFKNRVKVLGWTEKVASLMQSADILISKLGLTFYEAMACGLPMIALKPPPGSERVQYDLLESLGTGRAVSTVEGVSNTVRELLKDPALLRTMRIRAEEFGQQRAAERLAGWMRDRVEKTL